MRPHRGVQRPRAPVPLVAFRDRRDHSVIACRSRHGVDRATGVDSGATARPFKRPHGSDARHHGTKKPAAPGHFHTRGRGDASGEDVEDGLHFACVWKLQ